MVNHLKIPPQSTSPWQLLTLDTMLDMLIKFRAPFTLFQDTFAIPVKNQSVLLQVFTLGTSL